METVESQLARFRAAVDNGYRIAEEQGGHDGDIDADGLPGPCHCLWCQYLAPALYEAIRVQGGGHDAVV